MRATTVFVHIDTHQYNPDETRYAFFESDMSDYGYKLITSVPLEFEQPSKQEVINTMVKSMENDKSKILAEAHVKANQIQERIDSLLCLENKS